MYYNTERPHQNLENEHYEELHLTREKYKGKILYKSLREGSVIVKIWRREGVLNFYYPKAS